MDDWPQAKWFPSSVLFFLLFAGLAGAGMYALAVAPFAGGSLVMLGVGLVMGGFSAAEMVSVWPDWNARRQARRSAAAEARTEQPKEEQPTGKKPRKRKPKRHR